MAPAHPSEATLLAVLVENPDDDATRGVLADLLISRGDPRGELMQLELAPPPHSREVVARIEALVGRHHARWTIAHRKLSRDLGWVLDRGLVATVEGPVQAMAKQASAIAKLDPHVRRLVPTLDRKHLDLAALAASPLGARARELHVHGSRQRPQDLRARGWAAVAAMPSLRRLEIHDVVCWPVDLIQLLGGSFSHLAIRGGWLDADCAAAFEAVGTQLRSLSVSTHPLLRLPFATSIGGRCRALVRLEIPGAWIGDSGLDALLPALATVRILDLRGNDLTAAGLAALFGRGVAPNVREFEIASGNQLGAATPSLLGRWESTKQLTRLVVSDLSPSGLRELADMKQLAKLTSLAIHYTSVNAADTAALLGSPHLANARIWIGDRELVRKKPKRGAS